MKKTLLASLFIFLGATSFAQETQQHPLDPAHTNLDSLSTAYFNAGDNACITVEAVKDGLISDPSKPYNIDVQYNKLTVNGIAAPKDIAKKYFRKVLELNLINGYPSTSAKSDNTTKMSIIGDCVCDLKAPVHQLSKSMRDYVYAQKKLNDSLMTQKLLALKIISNSHSITINGTSQGIFINNQKLTVAQERAITPYLDQETFLDNMESDFASGKVTPVTDPDKHNFLYSVSR